MEEQHMQEVKEKKGVFDDPKNVRMLLTLFFTSCVIIFGLDIFVKKHSYFPWEHWAGFYAVFGFVACVVLVIVAKYVLRPLVMRSEDYYD